MGRLLLVVTGLISLIAAPLSAQTAANFVVRGTGDADFACSDVWYDGLDEVTCTGSSSTIGDDGSWLQTNGSVLNMCGLNFPWLGGSQTALDIHANGCVSFWASTVTPLNYINQDLGSATTAAMDMVCPWWTDWYPPTVGASISYGQVDRLGLLGFVVSWNDIRLFASRDDPATTTRFQVVLWQDGTIQFNYDNTDFGGLADPRQLPSLYDMAEAGTVGFQNSNQTGANWDSLVVSAIGGTQILSGDTWLLSPSAVAPTDNDGDLRPFYCDCDETDPTVYDGNSEIANNGVDDNCNGLIDEVDGDGDGFAPIAGGGTDCDDGDALINPAAQEICDYVDNNCDGSVDENLTSIQYVDADNDNYGTGAGVDECPGFGASLDGDCDDNDPARNPGAVDTCGNGIDEDCNAGDSVCVGLCSTPDNANFENPTFGATPLSTGDDVSRAVALPWGFPWAGGVENFLCVSTNGWAVFNSNGTSCDVVGGLYTNQPLATQTGFPDHVMAVWWDDWVLSGGAEGVYTASAGNRFYVRWIAEHIGSSVGNTVTFDLVLDQSSGNIFFQYSDVTDSNATYSQGLSGTTGIVSAPGETIEIGYNSAYLAAGDRYRFSAGTAGVDGDGDGLTACGDGDCDDTDPTVYPGAPEVCDGVDNNCDGALDPTEIDNDGDGYGSCQGDCDDSDPSMYPGAPQVCNGLDNDCDGAVDTGPDNDGDGVGSCGTDCDDNDPNSYPGAPELCDGVDNDCDGLVFLNEFDQDGDGFAPCAGDCDDGNSAVYPGAVEACDGVDNDCDPATVENVDSDGDGVTGCAGDCDDSDPAVFPGAKEACNGVDDDCDGAAPGEVDADMDGQLACAGDCDDNNPLVYSGATEVCDGIDNNCDNLVDEAADIDGDGFDSCVDCNDGDPAVNPAAVELCNGVDDNCDGALPADEQDADSDLQSACAGDCDDADPAVNSAAGEICDGIDNNCDGSIDESSDSDADGFDSCVDCNDNDPAVNPAAVEACNGVDDDCDGDLPLDEWDRDNDGQSTCMGDCDDNSAAVNSSAPEICDGIDNNCDGIVDEGADLDGDGASNCVDCNDADPARYPGAVELCDGADNDCDLVVPQDELDADSDGYRACNGDCNDFATSIQPGATEVCNGVDDNCDGITDDVDADGDGHVAAACGGSDCADDDAAVNPAATEICNSADDNCDGVLGADEVDADGDGYSGCTGDCDESLATVNPGQTEICNGTDDDCDGVTDFVDIDGDGFVAAACGGLDCDDSSAAVSPNELEICDGVDTNCDGTLPAEERDNDGDGFVPCLGDCDDTDETLNPDAEEICDGIDDNCNALIDDNATPDWDGDGDVGELCGGSDCDDTDDVRAGTYPEECGNNIDEDCTGVADDSECLDIDPTPTEGCDCSSASASAPVPVALLGLLPLLGLRRRAADRGR